MKKKFLEIVNGNKAAVCASLASMGTAMAAMPAMAEGTSEQISTALQTGLNTAVSDFVGYVAIVLPIGLTVFAATFGVKKGISFFKTIAGK